MRHINIPLFVPHAGCPNQCSFCNQRTISGTALEMTPERAVAEIERITATPIIDCEVEIAFFGGSFTAIERDKMTSLLQAAQPYIDAGKATSIRISTRPDAINDEILDILAAFRVKTIELGIQSMSDKVLSACRRGHSVTDSINACQLIVKRGFTLGGQMMVGLPESTLHDEIETAKMIVSLGAVEARIYPTVVFRDTELCHQTEIGEYRPLSIDEAVSRTCSAMEIFEQANVKLLRIGLCENEGLHNGAVIGGALHPAMGELCRAELYRRRICKTIENNPEHIGKPIVISVAKGQLSAAIGQRRSNLYAIKEQFSLPSLRFIENKRISGRDFEIIAESEQLCD